MSSVVQVRRVPRRPFILPFLFACVWFRFGRVPTPPLITWLSICHLSACGVAFTPLSVPQLDPTAMTSNITQFHPLSERQERRLIDYLDTKYLEIRHEYSRRHQPGSNLPTLGAYLLVTRPLLTVTLQVPPIAQSGMLRTSLLLRLTGTVMEDVFGYSPHDTDLTLLLEWLDILDRGWLTVLSRSVWDPARGEGLEVPEKSLDKCPPPTQTDNTRIHSLLITGISALDNWMKENGVDEDKIRDMRDLGYQIHLDELFHRTLTRLHELQQDNDDDEEELLARLPSWSPAEENLDVDAQMDGERAAMDGSNEDMRERLYDHT
ncbi:hypothetical protein F5148DRAFT_1003185 [Russula earlei]|uniref:Uncharacterized protein n=1 Tax=Russula earlei TaxID=71964 RepID=A0ACC0TXC7_9AGAM|nr:hypothetical protein F5148DRAFT_1003185 [Russula earlei]